MLMSMEREAFRLEDFRSPPRKAGVQGRWIPAFAGMTMQTAI